MACAPLLILLGVLAGVWLGFKISLRDAATLARVATEAEVAKRIAQSAEAASDALRAEWQDQFERLERKRASAAGAVARAGARANGAAPEEQAPPPEGRERRKMLQRALSRGAVRGV